MTELYDDRDIGAMKGMLFDYLVDRFGIANPNKAFNCIFPDHDDRNPSAHFYPDTNTIYCHGCNRGGDIFAVKGIVDGLDSFPEQVRGVAEDLNFRLSDRDGPPRPLPKRKPRPPFAEPREAGCDDCSEACGQAYTDLYLPGNEVGRRYLRWRGLDDDDIARWGLGFTREPKSIIPTFRTSEPEALGFITIPFWNSNFTEARYAMVRTISRGFIRNKEWRPSGITSPLWNEWMLTASLDVVLVTEGIIDAMALYKLSRVHKMAHGRNCMALGGTAGAKRLAQILYHAKPSERPGLLVICMDMDDAGKRTRDQLSADLCKIGVAHICVPAYPGGAKDADEWLMAGKGVEWDYMELAPTIPDGLPMFKTRWGDG